MARIAAAALAGAVLVAVAAMAGGGGLLYLGIFALALVPGLPLGFLVFGRRHAAGWILGAVLGYVLTQIAIWAALFAGLPSGLMFLAGWLAVTGATFATVRGRPQPILTLPAWTRRDTIALLVVLLTVPAIAGPPLARVGAADAQGNRYYRAYFTADFVWHMALTSELAKASMPPRNPYLAAEPIHYYWTYFLLPAAVSESGPAAVRQVEDVLKVNAVGTALLFVCAIFIAAWTAVPRAAPVAVGVLLAIVASSAEGAYALTRLWERGEPLARLRSLNIDALSAWDFQGLRVDGLARCFWWVPQHSMAYALGLVALAIVIAARSSAPRAAVLVAGLALAGSVACNPFVGAVFALVWGVAAFVDALGSGQAARRIGRYAVAAIPVVLAVGWCAANQMVEGAGHVLQVGWLGDARNAPILTLFLSLGPALVPAAIGLWPTRGLPLRALSAAVLLAGVALALLYFVRLSVDTAWVGFRAGQIFLVAVPALTARALIVLRRRPLAIAVLGTCVLAAGLPTTIIDAYNAQDIGNQSMGPGFHWTVRVTRDELDAAQWLRTNTPSTAIVQIDPTARGRESWSFIPSFAERRMAAGLPISLLDVPAYHERSAQVRQMYATADARQAWSIGRALRINYVYVDRVERDAYPHGTAKFADRRYFEPAYRNAEVVIYRVQ